MSLPAQIEQNQNKSETHHFMFLYEPVEHFMGKFNKLLSYHARIILIHYTEAVAHVFIGNRNLL